MFMKTTRVLNYACNMVNYFKRDFLGKNVCLQRKKKRRKGPEDKLERFFLDFVLTIRDVDDISTKFLIH